MTERALLKCDSIDNPISREEHLSKVRMCARRVLRSQDIERLIQLWHAFLRRASIPRRDTSHFLTA